MLLENCNFDKDIEIYSNYSYYVHSDDKICIDLFLNFRNYITASYGKKIYSETQQLQREKVKFAIAKNQLILLERCMANNIMPKSFCIKSPILSKKDKNLIGRYQKKLLQLARNEAKERMYKSNTKVKYLSNSLKHKVLEQDYETIIDITDKTKEKLYIKKKTYLYTKFNTLKNATVNNINNTTPTKKTIKEGVINLTGKELNKNKIRLLNLGTEFVQTYNRQQPYMYIIQTTEICALELENDGYFEKAERLRQLVSKILSKDVNKKHRNNLTVGQRKAIREIKNDTDKVYPFDKGSVFVTMKEEDAIKRTEEQIGKSVIIDYDPTAALLNKFQKERAKLRKEGKFDNKTYYKAYPSDVIPPRIYGVIKAHKPEKTTQ